jgi:tungstate transport system permease protein
MGAILFDAVKLIVSGNREVFFIAFTSLRLATASTLIAALFSIPLGIGLHFGRVPFKRPIITVLSSLMAVPTVVIGLMVFSLLSRSGPLGGLNLLFTPAAVVIGQTVLVVPILTSLVHSGLSRMDPRFYETLITLGARQKDVLKASILEARYIIASALLAGFGRVIGEVGVSMMLGGNIRWYTRTMTTSIALETSKGQFELGLSLGLILLVLALAINMLIHGLVKSDA